MKSIEQKSRIGFQIILLNNKLTEAYRVNYAGNSVTDYPSQIIFPTFSDFAATIQSVSRIVITQSLQKLHRLDTLSCILMDGMLEI